MRPGVFPRVKPCLPCAGELGTGRHTPAYFLLLFAPGENGPFLWQSVLSSLKQKQNLLDGVAALFFISTWSLSEA